MSDDRLTKQSEAIITKLQRDGHVLNKQELEKVRKALSAFDGLGMLGRFLLFLAAVAGAVTTLMNFGPWGGK